MNERNDGLREENNNFIEKNDGLEIGDLSGVGRAMQAIPKESWKMIVKTACDTFSSIVAPITATFGGLGRLIEAKFDGMVDAQKVYASDTVRRAKEKVDKTSKKTGETPNSIILIRAIENASNETDPDFREIWANLIANELLENQIHPEFPRILERLSKQDAIVLIKIADTTEKSLVKRVTRTLIYNFQFVSAITYSMPLLLEEKTNFHHLHLNNLGLINKVSGKWELTLIGEEFLKAISDPSFEYIDTEATR